MERGKPGENCMMPWRIIETQKYTYKTICKCNGTILADYNNKFICQMDLKKNNLLYKGIDENFYIKVLKRAQSSEDQNTFEQQI